MPLRDVLGHPAALKRIERSLRRGQVPHAWLFHGPDGVGKELAALTLTQALTCPVMPREGCGTCPSCTRVMSRNHPDVTVVLPEDEQVRRGHAGRSDFTATPSRDIRIEQIRRLQDRLQFRALEAPTKVALLITAHAMNANAQNALLKTLEEPPPDTVLVLISSAPDKLLPTIRSRCARVTFGPLPAEVLVQRLKAEGLDEPQAHAAAAMAQGSLGRALSIDVKALGARKDIIQRFEALSPADARGWLHLAEALGEDRVKAEAALELLQTWLHDVAVVQAGGASIVNSDLHELAVAAGGKVSPAGLHRRWTLVDEARNAITQRNGQARLQLERMLVEMFT